MSRRNTSTSSLSISPIASQQRFAYPYAELSAQEQTAVEAVTAARSEEPLRSAQRNADAALR
jgi:hypothetical protein